MPIIKKIVLLSIFSISYLSGYHSFQINMNDEELESGIELDLAQFVNKFPVNRYFVGLNYLYVETDENIKNQTEYMFDFDIMMRSRLTNFNVLTFGLGAKALKTKIGNLEVSAIPIGLYINFAIPIIKSLPISITTQFYYSPKPLTFSDGDKYLEQRYELSFEIIKMGEIFIGYRDIVVTPQLGARDIGITKQPYFGIKIGF